MDTNLTRWINQLSSTNYPDISIACSKILAVGSNAVPALVNALEHQKGRIRSWSIHLLDQLQATNACPALYKTYHDADSTEKDRPYIVLLLGEFGGDT